MAASSAALSGDDLSSADSHGPVRTRGYIANSEAECLPSFQRLLLELLPELIPERLPVVKVSRRVPFITVRLPAAIERVSEETTRSLGMRRVTWQSDSLSLSLFSPLKEVSNRQQEVKNNLAVQLFFTSFDTLMHSSRYMNRRILLHFLVVSYTEVHRLEFILSIG